LRDCSFDARFRLSAALKAGDRADR